jgi:uncharacterized protein DUF6159
MAGSVSRSFRLLNASWSILGRDPKLLIPPLVSFVASIGVGVLFYASGLLHATVGHSGLMDILTLYLFYACVAFIGISCNSIVVAVAMERLNGRDATLADGWAIVRRRMPQVLGWALVSATVGVVMRIIQERLGLVGLIATLIGNLAWALATFFVVPVLLFEPVDVRGAIKRSAKVFRDRWGEQVTAQLTIGAGLIVVWIPLMVVGALVLVVSIPLGVTVLVVGFVAVLTVTQTLNEIFTAALYRYAVVGAVPPGMDESDFTSIIKPRRFRLRRRGPSSGGTPPRPDTA